MPSPGCIGSTKPPPHSDARPPATTATSAAPPRDISPSEYRRNRIGFASPPAGLKRHTTLGGERHSVGLRKRNKIYGEHVLQIKSDKEYKNYQENHSGWLTPRSPQSSVGRSPAVGGRGSPASDDLKELTLNNWEPEEEEETAMAKEDEQPTAGQACARNAMEEEEDRKTGTSCDGANNSFEGTVTEQPQHDIIVQAAMMGDNGDDGDNSDKADVRDATLKAQAAEIHILQQQNSELQIRAQAAEIQMLQQQNLELQMKAQAAEAKLHQAEHRMDEDKLDKLLDLQYQQAIESSRLVLERLHQERQKQLICMQLQQAEADLRGLQHHSYSWHKSVKGDAMKKPLQPRNLHQSFSSKKSISRVPVVGPASHYTHQGSYIGATEYAKRLKQSQENARLGLWQVMPSPVDLGNTMKKAEGLLGKIDRVKLLATSLRYD